MSAATATRAGIEVVGPELDRDLGAIARRALWRRPTQRRLLPGHDRELHGWSWRLGDQYGDVWRPMRDLDGRKVWTCEQCPELALKWTAPALAVAGPFVILPVDPDEHRNRVNRRRVD